ncbi:MAG TPA: acetate--CoA ligase [Opitutales bacterium]|nr:acetate--CoA ligase [Opitutales bacterium]
MSTPASQFDTVNTESRVFPPSAAFSRQAHIKSLEQYQEMYARSIADPQKFWADIAGELHWYKKWHTVLNTKDAPFFKWFEGGETNLCYNCVDRHLHGATRNKAAIIFEGEPGDTRVLTYSDLHREVCLFANTLKSLGVKKGDKVMLYMPMVPELAIAVLACARIGAPHSVIFGGFSSESIKDRVLDCRAKFIITSDGGYRRGKVLPLKHTVDEAIAGVDCVQKVLVVAREPLKQLHPVVMKEGRDVWYHEAVAGQSRHHEPERMDAEDLLFILYTSGSTGKPKGIMHTTGGYMTYAYLTTKYIFDLKPEDVFWCTADIGWVTGHSYIVYGPLQNAATVVMFEGTPNWPENDRFWQIVEKYSVTVFYTAPTAIRACMKWGEMWPQKHDLTSLRLLGSVGESINPEAWMWYHNVIGGGRCPIVDTWWQTETGGIMLTPLPGAIPTKPGSATVPFFGIEPAVLDDDAKEVRAGILAIKQPWPGIMRGIWGDPERFKSTYFSKWGGKYYFPGDGARKDPDGYYWILGRVDDVVNVSAHRIGTAELESVYVEHPSVAESAVVGIPHELKGQALISFVTVKQGKEAGPDLIRELNDLVAKKIGKFALPDKIIFSADLPKTRSGKIMRRLLRDIAEGRALGNVTTLADPSVIESLKEKYATTES